MKKNIFLWIAAILSVLIVGKLVFTRKKAETPKPSTVQAKQGPGPEATQPVSPTYKDYKSIQEKKRVELLRKAEIASLKKSIASDQNALRELEKKGAGIDLYKFTENSLQKRKDRLKQLLSV